MAYTYDDLPDLLRFHPQKPGGMAVGARQGELEKMRCRATDESPFVGTITLDEALELYTRVRALRPAATIEIGMLTGASTLTILKALEDNGEGEHHVCDPFQSTYGGGRGIQNVRAAGLESRLRFEERFPEEAFASWPEAQLAFIDGSHLFDLTMLDLVLVDKRLAVGGLVGLHDLWMPALRKVARWAVANRGYEVAGLPPRRPTRRERARSALAAVLRRAPHAERIWTQELLRPWHELDPSGEQMTFLRKTRSDDRDWHDFRPF